MSSVDQERWLVIPGCIRRGFTEEVALGGAEGEL